MATTSPTLSVKNKQRFSGGGFFDERLAAVYFERKKYNIMTFNNRYKFLTRILLVVTLLVLALIVLPKATAAAETPEKVKVNFLVSANLGGDEYAPVKLKNVGTGEEFTLEPEKTSPSEYKLAYMYENNGELLVQKPIELSPGRYEVKPGYSSGQELYNEDPDEYTLEDKSYPEFEIKDGDSEKTFKFIDIGIQTMGDNLSPILRRELERDNPQLINEFNLNLVSWLEDKNGVKLEPNRICRGYGENDSLREYFFVFEKDEDFYYKFKAKCEDKRLRPSQLPGNWLRRYYYDKDDSRIAHAVITTDNFKYRDTTFSNGADVEVNPVLDKERIEKDSFEIVVPKDLPNLEVYVPTLDKAYVKLKTIKEEKNLDFRREQFDADHDVYTAKIPEDCNGALAYIVGGGEYRDKNGNVKQSGYVRSRENATFSRIEANHSHPRYYFLPTKKADYKPKEGPDDSLGMYSNMQNIRPDIYTNIRDDGGYEVLPENGEHKLRSYRIPQATGNDVTNQFFEPDHFCKVFGDSVEISDRKGGEGNTWREVNAKKKGASIVAVRYDEMADMSWDYLNDDASKVKSVLKNGIDPTNIGIVIYDVGGAGDKIKPNIGFRKYDTMYFYKNIYDPTGKRIGGSDHRKFSFSPKAESGIKSVEYHKPIQSMKDYENDHFFDAGTWVKAKNSSGKYSLNLRDGRNIIKIKDNEGNARYFALKARAVNVTSSNLSRKGKAIRKGDKIRVSFSDLTLPLQKMTAIYNPGFPDTTYLMGKVNGKDLIGPKTQYFISVNNYFDAEATKDNKLTFSNIRIHSGHFGSGQDAHCDIDENGLSPNFSAPHSEGIYCFFEDLNLPVTSANAVEGKPAKTRHVILSRMTSGKRGNLYISWTKVKNADGYMVYMSRCNSKKHKYALKKCKTVKNTDALRWNSKRLKRASYKSYVAAYKVVKGRKVIIAKSRLNHAVTEGRWKWSNPRSIKAAVKSLMLSKGKSKRLTAKVTGLSGKKLIKKGHGPMVRWISSNSSIATVSRNGVVKAKKKGICKVYAIAVNGMWSTVSVSVR